MKKKVLITGGAGFIGSHTADLMSQSGFKVRIMDNLSPKTHNGTWPTYLKKDYELIKGDVRSKKHWQQALNGVDYVIHLAAKMDLTPNFSQYSNVNVLGTSNLYEVLIKKKFPIKKVILASSQFVYGQGRWQCKKDGIVYPKDRQETNLRRGYWDPVCPFCGGKIRYLKNTEDVVDPPNQYAISKYASELISLKLGKMYNIPTVAMRYSIVHGGRQSIKSLYSGALRQFVLWLLAGKDIQVYEDGKQLRDFVSVKDVASANLTVMLTDKADFEVFNVGGERALTVSDLAKAVSDAMNKKAKISKSGIYRLGDIRNAVSDTSKLRRLGWRPQFKETDNIIDFIDWVNSIKDSNIKTKGGKIKLKSLVPTGEILVS